MWEPELAAPAPFEELFAAHPTFAGLDHSWLERSALDDFIGAPHEDLPRYLTVSDDGRFALLAGHDRGEQVFMDQVVSLHEQAGQPLTLVIIAGGLFYANSAGSALHQTFSAERREFYTSLRWHEQIVDRAESVSPGTEYVALHIRTTDRSLESPTRRAITSALTDMRSRTGVSSLFIAADTPEGRDFWGAYAQSIGFDRWCVEDTDFSRVTLSGGRSAAVDWLLLSRAQGLTFAAASTFSSEAATAAGCETWPLEASYVTKTLRRGSSHLRNVITYPSRRLSATEESRTADPGHEGATSPATEESTPGRPPSTDPHQQASGH